MSLIQGSNGDVQAATCQKTQRRRRTRVGVTKSWIRKRSRDCHPIRAGRHVVGREHSQNHVRTPVNYCVMLDHVHPVRRWARRSLASVVRKRPGEDV